MVTMRSKHLGFPKFQCLPLSTFLKTSNNVRFYKIHSNDNKFKQKEHLTLNHGGLHIICLNMFLAMTFPCKLLITLITRILDTFMFRLNMFLKTTHCCSLIITQITRILDTFMNRLKMCFKINLFCKLFSTMIRMILEIFMDRQRVFSEGPFLLLDNKIYHKET